MPTILNRLSLFITLSFGIALSTARVEAGADINEDGYVNFLDIQIFSECFEAQLSLQCFRADLNSDFAIDFLDLDIIVASFLRRFPVRSATQNLYSSLVVPMPGIGDYDIGDLDNDGIDDLVGVGAGGPVDIYVATGNGDGTYSSVSRPQIDCEDDYLFSNVKLLHLNGDKYPDLFVTCNLGFEPVKIATFYNNQDGSFELASTAFIGVQGTLVIGLFNDDNLTDVAVIPDGGVQDDIEMPVFLNDGEDILLNRVGVELPDGYINSTIGDTNADGLDDIVVVYENAQPDRGFVSISLATGPGLFQPFSLIESDALAPRIIVGDVNNDSLPDIVTGRNDELDFILSNSGGGFDSRIRRNGIPTGFVFVDITDINADGLNDLVMSSSASAQTTLLGLPNGELPDFFSAMVIRTESTGGGALKLKDIDGDGTKDALSIAGFLSTGIAIRYGLGNGLVEEPTIISNISSANRLTAGDANGDGNVDIISTTNLFGGQLNVVLGNGNGGSIGTITSPDIGGGPFAIESGFLNGDKNLDIVVSNSSSIRVFNGNGGGTFVNNDLYPVSGNTNKLLVDDLNQDGRSDIILAPANPDRLEIRPGQVDGTFNSLVSIPVPEPVRGIAIADLNVDGLPDIVVKDPNNIRVYMNNGNLEFVDAGVYFTDTGRELSVGLINGDSIPDILSYGQFQNTSAILFGQKNGEFLQPVPYPYLFSRQPLVLADVTGDSLVDIVSVLTDSPRTVVWKGDGTGDFPELLEFGPMLGTTSGTLDGQALVVDMNGDSQLDVVLGVVGSNQLISILLNKL